MSSNEQSRKRKTLHDHFQSPEKSNYNRESLLEKHACASTCITPRLAILRDFVTATAEASLLAFLDKQTGRTDVAGRAMHYGGTY